MIIYSGKIPLVERGYTKPNQYSVTEKHKE